MTHKANFVEKFDTWVSRLRLKLNIFAKDQKLYSYKISSIPKTVPIPYYTCLIHTNLLLMKIERNMN